MVPYKIATARHATLTCHGAVLAVKGINHHTGTPSPQLHPTRVYRSCHLHVLQSYHLFPITFLQHPTFIMPQLISCYVLYLIRPHMFYPSYMLFIYIVHFCYPSPCVLRVSGRFFSRAPFGISFLAVFPHLPAVSSYCFAVIPQWPAVLHHCPTASPIVMPSHCHAAMSPACHPPPLVIPPRVTPLACLTIYMIIPGHGPILNPGHTLPVGPSLTLTTPSTWAHVQLAVHYGQLSALAGHMIRTN